jgi:hypothetical protein
VLGNMGVGLKLKTERGRQEPGRTETAAEDTVTKSEADRAVSVVELVEGAACPGTHMVTRSMTKRAKARFTTAKADDDNTSTEVDHATLTMTVVGSEDLPRVRVQLNGGKEMLALLDTGCGANLLSESGAEGMSVEDGELRLVAAGGVRLEVVGVVRKVKLSVGCGNCVGEGEFWVCRGLKTAVTIGMPYLRGTTVDLNRGEWRWGVRGRKCTLLEDGKAKSCLSSVEEEDQMVDKMVTRCEMTSNNRVRLSEVLKRRKEAFSVKGELGLMADKEMRIRVNGTGAVWDADRKVPKAYVGAMRNVLHQMIAEGVIEPSRSPCVSQMVVIPKKVDEETGEVQEVRITVDYRKLNKLVVEDQYPMPRVQECIDCLSGCKVFSALDLRSGYFQLALAEESRPLTAFRADGELWQFCRCPMGTKDAPAAFQRAMSDIMADLPFAIPYMDDLFISSNTEEEHLEHLDAVLRRVAEAGVKLRPEKCRIAVRTVDFLGYEISADGRAPSADKRARMMDFKRPSNRKEVRAFLGAANYNRIFLKDFAKLAAPLHRLTEKNQPFRWSDEAERAFLEIKDGISTADCLPCPDYEKPFIITTDASNLGLGAVLSQRGNEESADAVVCYASRSLRSHETNYSATEKECLAVLFGVERFREYVLGRRFLLRTDHKPLTFLQEKRNLSGRLGRWWEKLAEYTFDCEYLPGPLNVTADALSRDHGMHSNDIREEMTRTTEVSVAVNGVEVNLLGKGLVEWVPLQASDPEIMDAKRQIEEGGTVTEGVFARSNLTVKDGLMFSGERIVVPRALRKEMAMAAHRMGHMGRERTLDHLCHYWWKGMRDEVSGVLEKCLPCARAKSATRIQRPAAQSIEATRPFEVVGIDYAGPLGETRAGNQYLLLMRCHFSGWTEAYATPDMTAKTTADKVMEFVYRHGVPERLLADQGRQFESELIKCLSEALGVHKIRTNPYNPRCNGVTERMNRTVKSMIRCYAQDETTAEREWDEILPEIMFVYHAGRHSTTGYTPFELMRGYAAREPMSLLFGGTAEERRVERAHDVHEYVEEAAERYAHIKESAAINRSNNQEKQRRQTDRKQHDTVKVGDLVMVANNAARRFEGRFRGPFRVTEKLGSNCKLDNGGRANTRNLKVVRGDETDSDDEEGRTNEPQWRDDEEMEETKLWGEMSDVSEADETLPWQD